MNRGDFKSPRIVIVGAGGPAGIGMTRCLKDYEVQGVDDSKWAHELMECPPYDEDGYDLLIPVPDSMVKRFVGDNKCFLPSEEEINLCQDKSALALVLKKQAPKTYWVRDTKGAGGKGSQMSSEFLPGKNVSTELVYKDGELLGQFTKERISYLVKYREPDVKASGSSMVSVCIKGGKYLKQAQKAVERMANSVNKKPNGFYGVDMKEDEYGVPKVTEINAGRLLTASYVYFYSLDYNLPKLGIEAFLGHKYDLGEYPEGYGIIRQVDKLPIVCHPSITKGWYENS